MQNAQERGLQRFGVQGTEYGVREADRTSYSTLRTPYFVLRTYPVALAVLLATYFSGIALAQSADNASADKAPAVLTIKADYAIAAGPLEKGRLLNGSVGGYEPMKNLNWLPEAYDNLAAVGFQMIRLDHLMNDKFYRVVSRDAAGKLQCDFTRLDRMIKPMLEKKMTPLMCLSYCPDVLIPKGGNDGSAPKDLDEWKQVVKAYVRHYKDLGHTGWYWEVWNEPDVAWFFRGSLKQYLDMYDKTAQAVKEIDPTAKIGGAADASVLSKTGRLFPLLDHVKQHPSVPLDFISYHKYGGSTIDEKPPYDMGWIPDEVKSQVESRGLASREIFVTEWNLTPVMNAGPGTANDTHHLAAGAAARMFNLLQHPALTRAFYFSPIEGYHPTAIFNGDLGMLTINNHKKAVYNLFVMFNYLGDTIVKADITGADSKEHHTYAMVTKDAAAKKTAVLMWNYADREASVELTLGNLPFAAAGKNILVTRYRIDADHANYYKDYQSGLRGYQPGPTENLEPVEQRIVAASADFGAKIVLPAFGVAQLLLEPTEKNVGDALPAAPRVKPMLNLAAGKPVSASYSARRPGWEPEYLVDEIAHSLPGPMGFSSMVHDAPDHAEWVAVDLGKSVRVDTVKLCPRDDQQAEDCGFPVDFKIQGSEDGSTWQDLAVRADYNAGRPVLGMQSFTFSATRCRYVRITATKLGKVSSSPPEYRLQLAELEVFGEK